MYRVAKNFEFCYAHRLNGYPGKCGNIHGHTVKVSVRCGIATLPENGMAIDFREMKEKIGGWIDENLDHRLILDEKDPATAMLKKSGEDVRTISVPPSAENLAKIIFDAVKKMGFPVNKVKFWESPSSVATYKE